MRKKKQLINKTQVLGYEILRLIVEPFTEIGNTEKESVGVGVKGRWERW